MNKYDLSGGISGLILENSDFIHLDYRSFFTCLKRMCVDFSQGNPEEMESLTF